MKIRNKQDKKFFNALKYLKTKKANYQYTYHKHYFLCTGKNDFYYSTVIISKKLNRLIKKLLNEKSNKK